VRDFCVYGMKKQYDYGIKNYYLPKSTILDQPRTKKIRPGKRTSYLDD